MAYHMNHKGGEIGYYRFTKTGERSGVMECKNPYPCDFDMGLVQAMAQRFAPAGSHPKVVHDTTKPCRAKTGDACSYLITW